MPQFAPLRVRGGRHRLRHAVRRGRRALAAGLAVTAAVLAASGMPGADGAGASAGAGPRAAPSRARPVEVVSAPVRIADGATVRLLRPGDRVDVIAATDSPTRHDDGVRVVVAGARVAAIPEAAGASTDGGALIVLSVPRTTAAELAGAGTTSRLAVTLC
ncbi:hypothetical protein [Streptomyces sp. SP18CS02]|uniref:hypothetical protein n=1 Tax=Streptomyces sp. SP18CS02 TaxID=3002531 RepID=UPI002E75D0EF|nr:hypothetical protein [Streptomyces sp. SP18CS02]